MEMALVDTDEMGYSLLHESYRVNLRLICWLYVMLPSLFLAIPKRRFVSSSVGGGVCGF